MRVAALKRLFERKAGSPRRFRHQIYARIAEREPKAWALCGTATQREKAIAALGKGGRLHPCITQPWDHAFATAFDKDGAFNNSFRFHHQDQPLANVPQGFSTTELHDL